MKAIKTTTGTYKVIEERRSFIYAEVKGKVKVFSINDGEIVNVDSVEAAPKFRKISPRKKEVNPIETWKDIALSVNNQWNNNTIWNLASESFGKLNANGNEFIESLLHSMFVKNKLSEKQAYYLAKFGVESGQLK